MGRLRTLSQDKRDYKSSGPVTEWNSSTNLTEAKGSKRGKLKSPHLAVNHLSDAGLRVLSSFWPDQHINVSHSWAGPQQLLQQNLQEWASKRVQMSKITSFGPVHQNPTLCFRNVASIGAELIKIEMRLHLFYLAHETRCSGDQHIFPCIVFWDGHHHVCRPLPRICQQHNSTLLHKKAKQRLKKTKVCIPRILEIVRPDVLGQLRQMSKWGFLCLKEQPTDNVVLMAIY